MSGVANALQPIGAFFRWWGAELCGLVPPPVRGLAARAQRPRYVLALGAEEAQFLHESASRVAVLCTLDPERPTDLQVADLRRQLGRRRRLRIRLSAEQALRTTVRLPLAAEENLAEVVGFELDRRTPFRAEDVYVAHRVEARDRAAKTLTVGMTVVPRRAIDAALALLERLGTTPNTLEVAPPSAGVPPDLVPLGAAQEGALARRWRLVALVAVAAVLLGASAMSYLPPQHEENAAESLVQQVARVRNHAMEAQALRERIAELDARRQAAAEAGGLTVNALLAEVTRLIPDDTWLDRLRVAGDKLTISGHSVSSARVIHLFEQSPLFEAPGFLSPVVQDPSTGMDGFTIETTLEKTER